MQKLGMKTHQIFVLLAIAIPPMLSQAQSLSAAQIKQIEEIAQNIANQHNANAASMVDEMTVSSRAAAIGRNVRLEYVLRVQKNLPVLKIREFADETLRDIAPKVCATNAKNPAFDRGLSYTFSYANTHGERLSEFTIDKAFCAIRR